MTAAMSNPTTSPHHAGALAAATDSVKASRDEANKEYYTFLNKEPHKLHCFYDSKSSFIHGTEGEQSLEPEYGQKEIHQRIMQLDFEDCKVLVSHVDSQASHDGSIVIMVLGEMSNKGGPSHKFCQCFVLAEQPAGYFVYNDIFRFLKEDIDNEYDDPVDPVPAESSFSYSNGSNSVPVESTQVAESLEIPVSTQRSRSPSPVREVPAQKSVQSSPPKPTAQAPPSIVEEETQNEVEVVQPPRVPSPQPPVPEPVPEVKPASEAPAPASTPAPAGPQKPKTWANLAAGNSQSWGDQASPAKGQVSNVQSSSPSKSVGPRSGDGQQHANRQYQKQAPKKQQNTSEERTSSPNSQSGDNQSGFREVQSRRTGYDRRQNRPNSAAGGNPAPPRQHSDDTYARSIFFNLQEGMNEENIRESFSKIGKVIEVTIPKGKQIVFVEFDAVQVAQSAIGKPFTIADVQVVPDHRKPKAVFNRYDNRNGPQGRGREGGNNERTWSNTHRRQNGGGHDGEGRKLGEKGTAGPKTTTAV
ncbi:hypothetical protein DFJ73DRAFT_767154 [Zopfochytrium polystomum]|nr:hypothetical protein DFJ73DRAFT_767154 [Zopfochytrium polystomum]